MEPLPIKEFRRLDLNAEEMGVPISTLMARAGKALAEEARARAGKKTVTFLCGKGHNGGDGFAAAGLLQRWNIPYRVVLMEDRKAIRAGAALAYLDLLPKEHVVSWKGARRQAWEDDLIVDCMLGSGIHGKPRAPYDAAIRWCNARKQVISCDIPSGLGTGLAVKPKSTVTFHAPKEGMTRANSGTIQVASIGIPKAAETEIGLGDLDAGYVRPEAESHKGANGRVLVVGGGPFTGAPHYAGMAAYRVGADMVHVATPQVAASVISTWGPDLLVHPVCEGVLLSPTSVEAIEDLMDRCEALVIGPGAGRDEATTRTLRDIMDRAGKRKMPMVVDADALDAVDERLLARHGRYMVLTPHAKEFEDLTGWKPVQANVTRFAGPAVVVLKGMHDIVSDGGQTRICRRGHATMTVGGTGDVLAGVIGALLAKGAGPYDAACAGTYLAGCAGEVAASIRGFGATATDIHEALPSVLMRLR